MQSLVINQRQEKLNKMTDGLELGDVYGATIEWIKAQYGDKLRLWITVPMWFSHAEWQLKEDLGNALSMSILVGYSQGLITVDKEELTVRLIHFILEECLLAHEDIGSSRLHSTIWESCLDEPDSYGPTPPLFAARDGHERVAKTPLRSGEVDTSKLDSYERTPLSLGASCGDLGDI